MTARDRLEASPRRLAAVAAGVSLLVAVGLGVLIVIHPIAIDAEWMDEIVEHRSPLWELPARVFDFLGGGWFGVLVVPVGIATAFLIVRRPWAASAFILGSTVSSGAVHLMKDLFGRARPDEILLPLESGSFPSGHTANAATLVVLLALLLRRRWIAIAGVCYVAAMALSRTYLGAHWVTDTIGGALVGTGMGVLVWVLFARKLRAELADPAPRPTRSASRLSP